MTNKVIHSPTNERTDQPTDQTNKQTNKQTNELRTNPLTNRAESFLKCTSSSSNQETTRILCNLKVHYRICTRHPRFPILRQINPFHALPSCFNTHCNIVLPLTLGSCKCFLSFRSPHQNPVRISVLPIHVTRSTHLILLISSPK